MTGKNMKNRLARITLASLVVIALASLLIWASTPSKAKATRPTGEQMSFEKDAPNGMTFFINDYIDINIDTSCSCTIHQTGDYVLFYVSWVEVRKSDGTFIWSWNNGQFAGGNGWKQLGPGIGFKFQAWELTITNIELSEEDGYEAGGSYVIKAEGFWKTWDDSISQWVDATNGPTMSVDTFTIAMEP